MFLNFIISCWVGSPPFAFDILYWLSDILENTSHSSSFFYWYYRIFVLLLPQICFFFFLCFSIKKCTFDTLRPWIEKKCSFLSYFSSKNRIQYLRFRRKIFFIIIILFSNHKSERQHKLMIEIETKIYYILWY